MEYFIATRPWCALPSSYFLVFVPSINLTFWTRRSFTASMMPILMANTLAAQQDPSSFSWVTLLLTVVGILAIHAAGNLSKYTINASINFLANICAAPTGILSQAMIKKKHQAIEHCLISTWNRTIYCALRYSVTWFRQSLAYSYCMNGDGNFSGCCCAASCWRSSIPPNLSALRPVRLAMQ